MSLEDEIKELNINIKKLIDALNNININKQPNNQSRLIPVNKWNDFYEYPSKAGLRWLIFNEKFNGATIWIKRIGRRVLIDEEAFFEWIKNNDIISKIDIKKK